MRERWSDQFDYRSVYCSNVHRHSIVHRRRSVVLLVLDVQHPRSDEQQSNDRQQFDDRFAYNNDVHRPLNTV